MVDSKLISTLKGFSGSEVTLYEHADGSFLVSKKAVDKDRIERLRKQYKKHLFFFQKHDTELFKTPAIREVNDADDTFFFTYDFVEGVTLRHFIEISSAQEIRMIIDKVVAMIDYFSKQDPFELELEHANFDQAVRGKIEVNAKMCGLSQTYIDTLLRELQNVNVREGRMLSHGDLTFDNIIVDKDHTIWLIDYDVFFPHVWLDISKFCQDIGGKWHEMELGEKQSNNKLLYVRDYFLSQIEKIDSAYQDAHNFLMALVFLRLYPYARVEQNKKAIYQKIINHVELIT